MGLRTVKKAGMGAGGANAREAALERVDGPGHALAVRREVDVHGGVDIGRGAARRLLLLAAHERGVDGGCAAQGGAAAA